MHLMPRDKHIDRIAKEVVRLCEQEKDTDNLKRLRKLLKENKQATENLFKALESGQIVDVIAERIAQKKQEHNELERLILEETSAHPLPTVNEVRFFLNQFRKGDVNDTKCRQALIDTFVNKIYLNDDKIAVLYNTQDSHSDVTIDDLSLSRVMLTGTVKIDILISLSRHSCRAVLQRIAGLLRSTRLPQTKWFPCASPLPPPKQGNGQSHSQTVCPARSCISRTRSLQMPWRSHGSPGRCRGGSHAH